MQDFKWFPDDPLYKKYYPDNPLYRHYFEREWGIPSHDDAQLFELLTIGIFAAGLNWDVAFSKRAALQTAFHNWDLTQIAAMTETDVATLLANPAIIRNRLKIEATIHNAQVVVQLQRQYGSFDAYLWSLVHYKQTRLEINGFADLPKKTPESDRIAKQMKRDGFKFTGSVAVYAYMLSVGLISVRLDGRGIEND
ncbi:DNA-3-methyladenine glycosylase I [uncultured Secundilactobacillus sp.]|uniref:DNA-3-methyladenine glycosylase I n=1 Tax=uncultured Secundilactobacillus sp. TaxID=2813935 RepID=UPI0025866B8A|nr:DNA-3-methyladenine glycosylase I [uncultured Secundilactobacillus sp.]